LVYNSYNDRDRDALEDYCEKTTSRQCEMEL
jgi:hypothetical protein